MKSIIKKVGLALGVICFAGTLSFSHVLAAEDIKDMGQKVTTNTNKVWTVNFKSEVDVASLNDSLHIKDLTNNANVDITIADGDDETSAKVNPPSGGYIVGHDYKLTIDKKAKSKKGINLTKSIEFKFKVDAKGSTDHNCNANVEVSPVISMLKKVTINSTNIPSAKKYKIEGNGNVFDIGRQMVSFLPDQVKVYIYDEKGTLLGTGMLDTSNTKNNINIDLNIDENID